MSMADNPEALDHLTITQEAETLVDNEDFNAIEERHAEMLAVWINYVRQLKDLPGSHKMTIEDSNAAFGLALDTFHEHATNYTKYCLDVTDSTSEAVAVLMGVGSILDKERVDDLNTLSEETGGVRITTYANKDAILQAFHDQLEKVETEDERVSAFSRLITFGFSDDMQALDALIVRVRQSVNEDETVSQREMIRFLYENMQDRLYPSAMNHVRDIAKTALGVTIGIVIARRFK